MTEDPIVVFWSAEDDASIAHVPDIRCCSARGETAEEALREAWLAVADILEDARERGLALPPPTVRSCPRSGRCPSRRGDGWRSRVAGRAKGGRAVARPPHPRSLRDQTVSSPRRVARVTASVRLAAPSLPSKEPT